MVCCIICVQRIYQKAIICVDFSIDSVKICLFLITFFLDLFCPVEKHGVTKHCLCRDSITLSLLIY